MSERTGNCGLCGEPFVQYGAGRPRLYCCKAHADKVASMRRTQQQRDRAVARTRAWRMRQRVEPLLSEDACRCAPLPIRGTLT